MKYIKLLAMVLIILNLSAAQEHKLFWDGTDWLAIERISAEQPELIYWIKSAYLSGLFDSKLFYQLKANSVSPAWTDSVFEDLLKPAPAKRLIATIDMIYRDPANSYLPLPNAIVAASMYHQNFSQAEIGDYIARSKKWINTVQYGY